MSKKIFFRRTTQNYSSEPHNIRATQKKQIPIEKVYQKHIPIAVAIVCAQLERAAQSLLDGALGRVNGMLVPLVAAVTPQHHDLALAAAQRGVVRDLEDDRAEELAAGGAHLEDARRQRLGLVEGRRRRRQLLFAHEAARDARGHAGAARRDYDADAAVAAAFHRASARVHHETDQEAL